MQKFVELTSNSEFRVYVGLIFIWEIIEIELEVTLASYVVLRDNLKHHEEQYRKKTLSFQFTQSPSNHNNSTSAGATPMPGKRFDNFLSVFG